MYLFMHVCMYICMCACIMHICMYVCMYVCNVCMYVCTRLHTPRNECDPNNHGLHLIGAALSEIRAAYSSSRVAAFIAAPHCTATVHWAGQGHLYWVLFPQGLPQHFPSAGMAAWIAANTQNELSTILSLLFPHNDELTATVEFLFCLDSDNGYMANR